MDHEAFIDAVATAAQLDAEGAERATRAVLQTLAERIDRGEARDLAARLPAEVAPWIATTSPAEGFDVDEFVRRVGQREGVNEPTAYGHARAVLDALARAVGPDGAVVSLEFEAAHAEVARRNLERAEVNDRVEIIVGAALDTLPQLQQRGEVFDLVFVDADKENNVGYVKWAIELSRPGTIIVVDNIARHGRVLDPAPDDEQARAVRAMFDMMGENPRLDTAAVQTVGAKGWDGFAVAVVS